MSRRPPLQASGVLGYSQGGKAAVVSPGAGKQIKIYSAVAQNRSGGASDLGMCVKLDSASYAFGTITAASTPDFLAANEIKEGTAVTIFTTVDNGGFLVQADRPFNVIGLTLSDACTAGTFEYTYYNGTAYVTLTTIAVPTYTATGDKLIVFGAPQDWIIGTTSGVGGSSSLYSIRVRATTAPSDLAQANALWVAQLFAYRAQVANNGAISLSFSELNPFTLEANEGLMPYFGVASTANTAESFYAIAD